MRLLLISTITICFLVSSTVGTAVQTGFKYRHPFKIGFQNAMSNTVSISDSSSSISLSVKPDFDHLRGGGDDKGVATSSKPPGFLKYAYKAVGAATIAAWTTIVLTTIRSNQPLGAMMPCWQHPLANQISVLAAVPLIIASYAKLSAAAGNDSWDELSSTSCRRQNLALVATGVASALWVNFAPLITKIPGTVPLASHQAYSGLLKASLIGAYGSAAALSAGVWRCGLSDDVRNTPFSWPGRIADGVAQSIVSIAPASVDNPVTVKYSLLTSGFLVLTAIQVLGPHPLAVIPSWTGRRISRLFPVWTFLAAVTSFDLKEASETTKVNSGTPLFDQSPGYRTLSNGIKGFGVVHLASKAGAIFLDPSFPESYHAVQLVPGWAAAAIVFVTLTLRSDVVVSKEAATKKK
mmetsp:Transcript_18191/g.20580  ORF Transcript_18191/g.20580 Transcript_18191/m.20580 type:complete len:407 (-) Transcript_18191:158-1378(-)